jgi:hypothetical protein
MLLALAPVSAKDEERASSDPARSARFDPDRDPPREISEWHAAIREGLAWLAANQQPDQGYWGSYKNGSVAVTSLALLALMANGNTESRGRYAENVRMGVDFLLSLVTETGSPRTDPPIGYIVNPEDKVSRMHGHGYATLALALAYGTWGNRVTDPGRERLEVMRRKLTLAVKCIERSQHRSGGWLYEPNPEHGHEGSVTVCQVQALRAARDAGIPVSAEVIHRALDYLLRSQDPDTGGFRYKIEDKNRQSYALTAAALTTLFGLGEYDRREVVQKGIRYMERSYRHVFEGKETYWFYGNLYAAQTLWQVGNTSWGRSYWEDWWPRMRDMLVRLQKHETNGAWPHPTRGYWSSDYGPAYRTAIACLILQVPLSVLPIFER